MARLFINRLPVNNLARKDLFVCLGIWLAFEIICLILPPVLRLAPQQITPETWFIASFPFGIGGSCLMAVGTQLTLLADAQRKIVKRIPLALLAILAGWVGLLGIAFPLFIVSVQIFVSLFAAFKV